MGTKLPVRCSENGEVASYLWTRRQEMAEANGISENLNLTLANAYQNICNARTPIKTLKDLSQIKGVGKWILRLMQGFLPKEASEKSPAKKATKAKGPKRYLPQKNSVAYALLISLYRGIASGSDFMKKQELIDAAEASGLSRTSIAPEKGRGKPGQLGSSSRDWYTGWSCMKTLITKGLVVKSSCPAKYMLTQEGKEAAQECLLRSGLVDLTKQFTKRDGCQSGLCGGFASSIDLVPAASADQDSVSLSSNSSYQTESNDHPVLLTDKRDSSDVVPSSEIDTAGFSGKSFSAKLAACKSTNMDRSRTDFNPGCAQDSSVSIASSFNLWACTSADGPAHMTSDFPAVKGTTSGLAMPPHMGVKFEDTYDVILLLDDRENFGSRLKKVVDNIHSQFKVQVEVRRLPIGDGFWIVRDRQCGNEYVLDFIVERKKVDDLCSSIRDNRYKDQKLRLQRSGLQKLIYLVEGDPNTLEAAESIKTACFTTEILEGFDVQRTTGLADTVRKYGHLTQAITQYYSDHFSFDMMKAHRVCPSFKEFVKKCQDLEKMTINDVFALQLMQVPQVTEEVALAVTELYPTLLSLARQYSQLEGNLQAQEELLKDQSKLISVAASRNIFRLIWGC